MKNISAAASRILLAMWLGAGLVVPFVAIPVVFSPAIKAIMPAESVGQIAQTILGRFFWAQLGFFCLACLARQRSGIRWRRCEQLAWTVLGVGSVLAAVWLHPKLRELHRIRYDAATSPSDRAAASAAFRGWHGASQVGNVVVLITLSSLVLVGNIKALRQPA